MKIHLTGSAHCTLVPYWAKRLGKKALHALQLSSRGGEIFCQLRGNRVKISGAATLYMVGLIYLDQDKNTVDSFENIL